MDKASKYIWLVARLAMGLPYPRKTPEVGDLVVETTHIMGLARHKLGFEKALGYVLEIDDSDGEWNKRYLIESLDKECGQTWWSNCLFEVVEEKEVKTT